MTQVDQLGGSGRGQNSSGRGRGMGGGRGLGPGGYCVCPDCGNKIPHDRGKPCFDIKCPACGRYMTREQSISGCVNKELPDCICDFSICFTEEE